MNKGLKKALEQRDIFFQVKSMSNSNRNILFQDQWRIIDQSIDGLKMNPIYSFAMDDCLCESVGSNASPSTARIWVHRPSVILGIQDTKLPYLKDGISFLQKEGFPPVIRNSGGLAVLLDEGVLNLTLVLPEKDNHLTIERGYEVMYTLVKDVLSRFKCEIKAGEVAGSYCPGSFDLSINGKKFAGISQRRVRKGAAIQIYLCITGSGSGRAQVIKNFYSIAKKDQDTKIAYPNVQPDVMASLSELLYENITIDYIKMRMIEELKQNSNGLLLSTFTDKESMMLEECRLRIIERNKKILGG